MVEWRRYMRLARGRQLHGQDAPERSLAVVALGLEAFWLALLAVAPLGGIAQSVSPLARAWPWLLAPGRWVFGPTLVNASVPSVKSGPALALFAVLLIGAAALAASALLPARRLPNASRRHLVLALAATVLFGLTLALLPTLPSDDVFSYVLYGRISVVHHANPLIVAPAAFPDDPFVSLVFWRGVRSVYGPVWLLLSSGITGLAQGLGGQLATYVALFKLLGLLAHLANAALIWAILGRLAPKRRLAGTLLYAWNPLCLLEFCASAHNDAVMLTFALLGIYWLVRGREPAALVAFGLSIATKYVLLAVLPFYFVLVARRLLREQTRPARLAWELAWRLAVVAGVVVVTMLPYWAGPQTLGAILYSPPAQQLDNSLIEAVSWPLRALAQTFGLARPAAAALVTTGLKVVAALGFVAIWARWLTRVRDEQSLLWAWAWVLFWYVTLASGWFWPWYATWPLALVALLTWSELSVATLLLAAGVLTLYAFLPLYAAPIYGLRAWLAFGPALGYLLLHERWPARALALGRRLADMRTRATAPADEQAAAPAPGVGPRR
jgi:hypothetical protein